MRTKPELTQTFSSVVDVLRRCARDGSLLGCRVLWPGVQDGEHMSRYLRSLATRTDEGHQLYLQSTNSEFGMCVCVVTLTVIINEALLCAR